VRKRVKAGQRMTEIDTGTHDLLAQVDEGVAILTMNRPERRNAFSTEMVHALARVLGDVQGDDDIGAVVLTGAGGAFCSGGDVKMMVAQDALFGPVSYDEGVRLQRRNQRETSGRLWSMPKPTIAMIPGPAAGAGFALALSCDLRYVADTAVFTTAFARVGLPGDYGGTWFLSRLVGSAKAKELYYFSRLLTARDALDLGIVNAVYDADELELSVLELARELANGPRVALRYMKENLSRAVHADLGDCLDLEVTHHHHAGTTEDHREAAQAFVAKRPPAFRGR